MILDRRLRLEIGAYLREAREKMGLNQKVCGKATQVSAQFLGAVESGKVPCPERVLRKLVSMLKLDKKQLARIFQGAIERQVNSWFK